MIQTLAEILEIESQGNGPFVRIVLGTSEVSRSLAAGRYVLVDLGGFLRETVYPARIEPDLFEALVPPDHPLAAGRRGGRVSLIGPLGRGYQVPAATRRLLLAADSVRIPVLLPLMRPRTVGEQEVTLLLAAETAANLYPLRLLPPSVEVHILTADGSAGRPGDLADGFAELVGWAYHTCVAADPTSYSLLARGVREHRLVPDDAFAEALVSPTMACGVGACQGCAVATNRGMRLACTDGPVFNLLDLHGR